MKDHPEPSVSFPLTPMLDWLNPFGAGSHSDRLLFLEIKGFTPGDENLLSGVPRLCHPTPVSIVP
jgi:hypothetical protein